MNFVLDNSEYSEDIQTLKLGEHLCSLTPPICIVPSKKINKYMYTLCETLDSQLSITVQHKAT